MFRSKMKSAAVVAAMAVAGLFATAAPSSAAATAAVSPTSVCGSGYSVIDSHRIDNFVWYLLYNNSNGYNCATLIRDASGKASLMSVFLQRQSDGKTVRDTGDYTTYAGPVYLHAAGSCVKWGGDIVDRYYSSPWEHCG